MQWRPGLVTLLLAKLAQSKGVTCGNKTELGRGGMGEEPALGVVGERTGPPKLRDDDDDD